MFSLKNSFVNYWLVDSYSAFAKNSYSKYIKYIFRYIANGSVNYQWSKFINSTEQHKRWTNYYGYSFLRKMQYSYLSLHLSKKEQLNILQQHYNWLFSNIKEESYYREISLFNSTFTDNLDNQHLVEIILQCNSTFEYEGEMSMLMKVNGSIQYTLTFSSMLDHQKSCFFIGGLQAGKQDVTTLDSLKVLTKTMHGLRPKQFILHALSILANQFDVDSIFAISNKNHVFNGLQRLWTKKQVKASLDGFWEEFDAQKIAKGNYCFKPLSSTIDLEEIASKKRSQYRKRQLILDDLNEQIEKNINHVRCVA
ncbi:VirK/YbjX family protein [Acinetobacter sp. MD2(2019)]|uniref:VirK/YbjX family protein n=1 Tax=Acinetobacter sp. MD2(2019) TaxID=2605273 RepID=UPI002D1E65EA|nr:DUF535 family protein [Acinetobacter sp. MD2(2019)]MEB3753571.1 DUF535 family protein [Acinetobacter sp. MD2(2019)]